MNDHNLVKTLNMLVNYNSRQFSGQHDPRVVIYNCGDFIR